MYLIELSSTLREKNDENNFTMDDGTDDVNLILNYQLYFCVVILRTLEIFCLMIIHENLIFSMK